MRHFMLILLLNLTISAIRQEPTPTPVVFVTNTPKPSSPVLIAQTLLPWRVGKLTWSPNGRFLVVEQEIRADDHNVTVRVYDTHLMTTERATIQLEIGFNGETDVAWSADSRFLAIHAEAQTQLYDVFGSRQLLAWNGTAYWQPGGTAVAALTDGQLQVYSLPDSQPLYTLRAENSPIWSQDGKLIAYKAPGKLIRVVEAQTGELLHELVGDAGQLSWSPDSQHVVLTSSRHLQIWTLATGNIIPIYNNTSDLIWSPDNTLVAAANDYTKVRIWDAETGELVKTLRGVDAPIQFINWNKNTITAYSRMVTFNGISPRITSWDTRTGIEIYSIQLNDLLASPHFRDDVILIHDLGKPLSAFNLHTGEEQWSLPVKSELDFTLASFSPDSRLAISSPDNETILVIPIIENSQPFTLNSVGSIWRIAWRPDSRMVAFTDEANLLYVWDLAS